jgi:predicted phosphodiesterase
MSALHMLYPSKLRRRYYLSDISIPLMLTMAIVFLSSVLAEKISEKGFADGGIIPSREVSNFNFIAVGDWGCRSGTNLTLNNILYKNPELILGLGDYSYEPTADCWLELIRPFESKLKIAIGNHDDTSSSLLNQYMNHFGLSKQFYSFDYQNVHFVVMSTEVPFGIGSEQYGFIQQDLANTSSDPDIEWIIVYIHKPFYHGCQFFTKVCLITPDLREIYHPLFDTYDIDLVLYGHHHSYERTYPLRYNILNESSPIITDLNMNNYSNPNGSIFVTVGTGGHSLYDLEKRPYFAVAQYEKDYGILNIDVTHSNKTLIGRFYTNNGSIIDHFSITKCPEEFSTKLNASKTKATNDYTNVKEYTRFCPNNNATIVVNNNNMTDLRPAGDYLTLSGSNFTDILNDSSLQLTNFTISLWFRTSNNMSIPDNSSNNTVNRFIAVKTGLGRDTPGDNLNYGIWMTPHGKLSAGFEDTNGTDYYVQSPHMYNDSRWHNAIVTYDGSQLRLYIDGFQVAENILFREREAPDNSSARTLRLGANALFDKDYFIGNIDEVRVWNRALATTEVTNGYTTGIFNTTGLVIFVPFDVNNS